MAAKITITDEDSLALSIWVQLNTPCAASSIIYFQCVRIGNCRSEIQLKLQCRHVTQTVASVPKNGNADLRTQKDTLGHIKIDAWREAADMLRR